jgi:hypothetical protein
LTTASAVSDERGSEESQRTAHDKGEDAVRRRVRTSAVCAGGEPETGNALAGGRTHDAGQEGALLIAEAAVLHGEHGLDEALCVLALVHVALDVLEVAAEELALFLEKGGALGLPGCEEGGKVVEEGERVDEVAARDGAACELLEDVVHLSAG